MYVLVLDTIFPILYCMDDRPSSIYWAGSPVRGCLVVQRRLNAIMEVRIRVQEGGPRRIIYLAEQSRGLKIWFAIQEDVSGDSIDKDTHHEGTGQRGTMKYLRESCYHRIECSITNSLTALMRK